MQKGSLVILLLLGFVSLESFAQKINLRPYVIDIPQTQEDSLFLDYIAKHNKQYASSTEF